MLMDRLRLAFVKLLFSGIFHCIPLLVTPRTKTMLQ